MLKFLFQKTNEYFLPTLRHKPLYLFVGMISFEVIFQYILFLQRSLNGVIKEGVNVPQIIVLANLLMGLMVSILFSFFLIMVVLFSAQAIISKKEMPWLQTLKELSWPLTVESLRALGKILLWLFLIIPGLMWYVRYFFVPFVVLLEPGFKTGKIDSLKLSHFLVSGHSWKVTGFIFITMVFSTLRFQDIYDIQTNPTPVILLYLVWATIQVYLSLMCYFLYQYLYEFKKDSIQSYLAGES